MSDDSQLFQRYLILYNRYVKMTKEQAGHIMSPCDPIRKLYSDTLKEMLTIMKEHPEYMDEADGYFKRQRKE